MIKPVLLAISLLFVLNVETLSSQDVQATEESESLRIISVVSANTLTQRQILQGETDWISDLEFSLDVNLLAVAETGSPYQDFENVQGKVRIWDTKTWEEITVLSSEGLSAMSLAFSPDNQRLALGNTTGEIEIWYLISNPRVEAVLRGHSTWVNTLAFDPGNSLLVSGSGYLFGMRGDYTVRLWLAGDWQEFYVLVPDGVDMGAGLSVTFNPIGTIIAAGMSNGTVHLWDGELKDEIAILEDYAWGDILFTPDSTQILFSARDGIRVWSVAKAIETFGYIPEYKLIAPLDESEFIFSLALSPDGTVVAAGYQDGTVRLWDMDTGERLIVLEGHTGRVMSLDFSPDGTLLASGGSDGTVRLWGIPAG